MSYIHRSKVGSAVAALAIVAATLTPSAASAHTANLPTRMQEALSWTNGTTGYVLKRVDSSANQVLLGSQNGNFVFEPASSIKFVHALHTERQLQSHGASPTQFVAVPTVMNSSCPAETPTMNQSLEFALEQMMEQSSNAHTEAIKDEFGQAALNQTALNLGASSTQLQHRIGCGSEALAHPNKLTLNDITLLYDKAFTDDQVLQPAWRTHLRDRMPSSMSQLTNSAKDEAITHYGADAPLAFYNNLKVAYKPGRYTFCTTDDCTSMTVDRSIAGYLEIPVQTTLVYGGQSFKMITLQKYVFGIFIQGATSIGSDPFSAETTSGWAQNNALGVLFRDELKSALASWF